MTQGVRLLVSLIEGEQGHEGGSPATRGGTGGAVRKHFWHAIEDCLDAASQASRTFAVDETDLENAARAAESEVVRDELSDVLRPECVQV